MANTYVHNYACVRVYVVYVCVYGVCMYVCVLYTYVYVYIHVYVCVCTCVCMCVYVCMYVCVRVYVCVCVYTYVCMYMYVSPYCRFYFFWLIYSSYNGTTIGLANPTEITHWFCDEDLRNNLPPDTTEGGVGHLMICAIGWGCTVLLPNMTFGCRGWKQLHICTLVPWYASWQ